MEGQEFLTEYRNISNKLKKRFLGRRPNVSEASEQFRQLGKRLEDSEEPQYAAFCHLATGRCEQTIGNSPGEIEAITAGARSFLKSEMDVYNLRSHSFEFQLTAAVSCYIQAAKLQEEQGRAQMAGGLYMELAEAFWRMKRPIEALPHYQRAASLFGSDIVCVISAKLKVASCYIATPDYHNALLVLSEVASLTSEQEHLHLFDDVQRDVEILRVLLLLIIEPSTHNTDPSLLSVLEKYRVLDEGFDPETRICHHLSVELSLLLQSLVMAVESLETNSVLYIEDELVPLISDQQRSLLRVLVKQTLRKV